MNERLEAIKKRLEAARDGRIMCDDRISSDLSWLVGVVEAAEKMAEASENYLSREYPHEEAKVNPGMCSHCGESWPCEHEKVIRLIAAYRKVMESR